MNALSLFFNTPFYRAQATRLQATHKDTHSIQHTKTDLLACWFSVSVFVNHIRICEGHETQTFSMKIVCHVHIDRNRIE